MSGCHFSRSEPAKRDRSEASLVVTDCQHEWLSRRAGKSPDLSRRLLVDPILWNCGRSKICSDWAIFMVRNAWNWLESGAGGPWWGFLGLSKASGATKYGVDTV